MPPTLPNWSAGFGIVDVPGVEFMAAPLAFWPSAGDCVRARGGAMRIAPMSSNALPVLNPFAVNCVMFHRFLLVELDAKGRGVTASRRAGDYP